MSNSYLLNINHLFLKGEFELSFLSSENSYNLSGYYKLPLRSKQLVTIAEANSEESPLSHLWRLFEGPVSWSEKSVNALGYNAIILSKHSSERVSELTVEIAEKNQRADIVVDRKQKTMLISSPGFKVTVSYTPVHRD